MVRIGPRDVHPRIHEEGFKEEHPLELNGVEQLPGTTLSHVFFSIRNGVVVVVVPEKESLFVFALNGKVPYYGSLEKGNRVVGVGGRWGSSRGGVGGG